MSSNKDDIRPRVSCLLFVMLLIDEVKDEGIIPFKKSRKHKLLLIELQSHIGDWSTYKIGVSLLRLLSSFRWDMNNCLCSWMMWERGMALFGQIQMWSKFSVDKEQRKQMLETYIWGYRAFIITKVGSSCKSTFSLNCFLLQASNDVTLAFFESLRI